MTGAELRTLGRVHGVLGWVSIAALVVALVVLWRRRSYAAMAGGAAIALSAATFATGAALHAPFQTKLRQRLFVASSALGWLFERKEHVAFGGLALIGAAATALWAERMSAADERAKAALRRAAALALGFALAFQIFALTVSIATSRRVGF